MLTTTDASSLQKKYQLNDLLFGMISSKLSNKSFDLLYELVIPQLSSQDHTLQKKAYRALFIMSSTHAKLMAEKTSQIFESLKENVTSLSPSSKKYRSKFQCRMIESVVQGYDALVPYLPQLLAEGIMNSKEVNTTTQEYSSIMLRSILHKICEIDSKQDDDDDDEDEENDDDDDEELDRLTIPKELSTAQQTRLCDFIKQITTGLAGTSDTMIGATVNVLTWLCHDYAPFIESILPDLLHGISLLLDHPSKQVSPNVLGFIKMSVTLLNVNFMKEFMPQLLAGVLSTNNQKHNRKKVTYLLEKMIKRFGYDYMVSIWPTSQKISFLNSVNKSVNKVDKKEGERRILKAKRSKSTDANQVVNDAMDLMDQNSIQQQQQQPVAAKQSNDEADGVSFNKVGKIVVQDKNSKSAAGRKRGRENVAMDDLQESNEQDGGDEEDEDDTRHAKKGRADEQGTTLAQRYLANRRKERESLRRGGSNSQQAQMGDEYKARRRGTGGDMKRKGMADPYAYLPLDAARMNKRNKNKSSHFEKLEQESKNAKKVAKRGGRFHKIANFNK
ncbi:RRP12-like protein [Acrasis kona]|uniref:RRP12-like protein n=1 Tax=Acrasis kona TaxID=1008807 RepID=A0AAW2ZAI1_9EUKA